MGCFKAAFLICNVAAAWSWGYRPTDQRRGWGRQHPTCKRGRMQSPVAISAKTAHPIAMPAMELVGYQNPLPVPVSIVNNGYSAHIEIPQYGTDEKSKGFRLPYIFGGPLSEEYEIDGLHFHWGDKNSRGAEHTVNDMRMALEMHIVHRNKKYSNLSEAMQNPDGLCVLGILFRAIEKYVTNLEVVTANMSSMVFPDHSAELPAFSLSSILRGLDTERFYTYKGSLTTPPCSEAVTWIVFPDFLSVSLDQLESFRSLLSHQSLPLVDNYRQLQNMNGRRIFVREPVRPPTRHNDSFHFEKEFEDNYV